MSSIRSSQPHQQPPLPTIVQQEAEKTLKAQQVSGENEKLTCSVWLKCMTVMVIVVEMSASVIIWAFVAFETRGYAGHYRTAINQLLSCLYGGVSKMDPSTNLTNIFKIVDSMSRQMAIYADEWALKSTLISIISL